MSAALHVAGVIGKQPLLPATVPRPAAIVASTSVEEATSDANRILQKRVSSLEEDLVVIHRRVRDTSFSGSGADSGSSGRFAVLQQSVQQMLSELADERRQRDDLEASIAEMENSLQQECNDRQAVLSSMAKGLEDTMQKLVRRIETGLGDGTSALQERAAKTEDLLRGLVARVEAGLETGGKSLQDKVPAAGIPLSPLQPSADRTLDKAVSLKKLAGLGNAANAVSEAAASARGAASGVRDSAGKDSEIMTPVIASSPRAMPVSASAIGATNSNETSEEAGVADPLPEPLLKVWDNLKQEHIMLKKKREKLVTAASEKRRSASRSWSESRGDSSSNIACSSSSQQTVPLDHGKQDRDSDTISLASSLNSGGHQPPPVEKLPASQPRSSTVQPVGPVRSVSPMAQSPKSSVGRPGLPQTPAGSVSAVSKIMPKAAPGIQVSRQVSQSAGVVRAGVPVRTANTSLQPGQAKTTSPVSMLHRDPQQAMAARRI